MKRGWVYIAGNYTRTVLYTGSTSNLRVRIAQHKNGLGSSFTRRYNVTDLLFFEEYPDIETAIKRERAIKEWQRAWKLELIMTLNPKLEDLFDRL